MPLIAWRKMMAGFSGKGEIKDVAAVVQHVTNTTIDQIIEVRPFSLDEITDGITYGRVLQTNLSSGALKIITAQSALLDLIPATTNTSDLGSSTVEWAEGYIRKAYVTQQMIIPVES